MPWKEWKDTAEYDDDDCSSPDQQPFQQPEVEEKEVPLQPGSPEYDPFQPGDGGSNAADAFDPQAPQAHGFGQDDAQSTNAATGPLGQLVHDKGIDADDIEWFQNLCQQEELPGEASTHEHYPKEDADQASPPMKAKTHAQKTDEEFQPTKFGWMNHCTVLISLFQMKRWAKLAEVSSKLACTESQRTRVQMLNSHIQKYGDSGPKRLGYPH